MNEFIIVNAIALDRSGALSILKQFIENIPDDDSRWLVFIPQAVEINCSKSNVVLQKNNSGKPMYKRWWWDTFGLNSWLKLHNINPIACISLQNTGFRVSEKDIPHFIYYHQPIPFFSNQWNLLKKEQQKLWFYKNIYPLFVKLFLTKDTIVFVQLNFIKEGFVKTFNHPSEKIYVYSPSIVRIEATKEAPIELSDSTNLFYPASNSFYKNHKVLYETLRTNRINAHLYVTIPSNEENVSSTGVIPYEDVFAMYQQCDCLVYPSYIESFGLPLLEAAQTGIPIIAADLPYSNEVLAGYEGVTFVPFNNPHSWADAVSKVQKG